MTDQPMAAPPPSPPSQGWAPGPSGRSPWEPRAPSSPLRSAIVFLVVGLVVGGVLTGAVMGFRSTTPPEASGAASINVDTSPVRTPGGDTVKVAAALSPAVATVIAREAGGKNGLGTGFVISHNGGVSYVLTNNHVVAGSKDLHALLPGGRNFTATLVGTDGLDDLAVISVPDGSLPVATFGASGKLRVGQPVIAIGSPLGNEGSVTQGIISARHRTISAGGEGTTKTETLQDVLQTDASINRGNSGGPLADSDGRVIGVNVAVAGDGTNIGFSIPSDLAVSVAEQLIKRAKVQHPFLGISYLGSTEAVENGQGFEGPGVLVTKAATGTPAAQAGFQPNDILAAIDGVNIDNGETLGGLIQTKHVGDTVDFTVRRGGNTISLKARLVERPGNATP
ncbi:MAG: S1C family serine protease [Candidatus Dormibacteria bacterium]